MPHLRPLRLAQRIILFSSLFRLNFYQPMLEVTAEWSLRAFFHPVRPDETKKALQFYNFFMLPETGHRIMKAAINGNG